MSTANRCAWCDGDLNADDRHRRVWVYVDPINLNGVTYRQVVRCPCAGGDVTLVQRLSPSINGAQRRP